MPTYIGLLKLTDQGSKDIMNAPARIEEGINLYQKMGGKGSAYFSFGLSPAFFPASASIAALTQIPS